MQYGKIIADKIIRIDGYFYCDVPEELKKKNVWIFFKFTGNNRERSFIVFVGDDPKEYGPFDRYKKAKEFSESITRYVGYEFLKN